TDAEGCFSIVIGKNRKKEDIVRARFILDQKEGESALNIISSLFSPVTVELRGCPVKERKGALSLFHFGVGEGGLHITPTLSAGPALQKEEECPRLDAEHLNNKSRQRKAGNVFRMSISCSDINSMLIRNYFTKFKLKTSKHNSFLI